MSKHTPGPWLCHKIVGVYAKDGELVASVHTPISSRSHDAELIAAAPELLAALQVVLRDYTAVHDIGDVEMQPALYQARAAITKATGEKA